MSEVTGRLAIPSEAEIAESRLCEYFKNGPEEDDIIGYWENVADTDVKIVLAELDRLRRWPKAVAAVRAWYPTEIFVGKTPDSDNAAWARMICDNIKREAEEGGDE